MAVILIGLDHGQPRTSRIVSPDFPQTILHLRRIGKLGRPVRPSGQQRADLLPITQANPIIS